MMRLMASFITVTYTRAMWLKEDGSIGESSTPGGEPGHFEGGYENNYASWVITQFVFAPGRQSGFEQRRKMPQHSGLNPVEGQKKWNDCMRKHLSEDYPEGKPKPTGTAVGLAVYGGLNDIDDSAMILALWAKESSFELRPRNDHGPLQLTSWWSKYSERNKLNLIVPGAYDSFGRPKDHPNRDRPFEGNIEANVMTAGNIIRHSRNVLEQSYGDIAYNYGPGPDKKTRDAYEDHAMKLQSRYLNFLNCYGSLK
jgi:hypothetical protein